jgi:hypothetical protein
MLHYAVAASLWVHGDPAATSSSAVLFQDGL